MGFVWYLIFCLKLWKGRETSKAVCTFYGFKDEPGPEASACSHNRYSLNTPAFMRNSTVWRWEPSCARALAAGRKPVYQCWLQLLAVEGQMKAEGWSWNQVEFCKFFNPVPVLKWGLLKNQVPHCLEPRHRLETEKAGHRYAASWEPSCLPCTQQCPPGPGRWGVLEVGRWEPIPGPLLTGRGACHTHISCSADGRALGTAWNSPVLTLEGGTALAQFQQPECAVTGCLGCSWKEDFCCERTRAMTKQTFCFCLVPAPPFSNYPFYCCHEAIASSHKGWQEHTRGDTANVVSLAQSTACLCSPAVNKTASSCCSPTRADPAVWHHSWDLNYSAEMLCSSPGWPNRDNPAPVTQGVFGLLFNTTCFHPPVKKNPPVTDWIVFPLPGSTFRTWKAAGLAVLLGLFPLLKCRNSSLCPRDQTTQEARTLHQSWVRAAQVRLPEE